MSNNIYGGITYPGTGLVFDKIYDNYKQAKDNVENDGVMLGRYVLIKYCERAFGYEEKIEILNEYLLSELPQNIFTENERKIDEQNYTCEFVYSIFYDGYYTLSFQFVSDKEGGYSIMKNESAIGGNSVSNGLKVEETFWCNAGDEIAISIINRVGDIPEVLKSYSFKCENEQQINYAKNYLQDGAFHSFDRTVLRKTYDKDTNTYKYEEIGKIESALPLADLQAITQNATDVKTELNNSLDRYDTAAIAIEKAASLVGDNNEVGAYGYPITAIGRDSAGDYYFQIRFNSKNPFETMEEGKTYHISAYTRFIDNKGDISGERYDNKEITRINTSKGADGGDIYISWHKGIPNGLSLVTYDGNTEITNLDEFSHLFIIENAQEGDYPISCIQSFATGYNNQALGAGSFATGLDNASIGAYSASFGKENIVNYAGSAFGRNNTINGHLGASFGQHNIINGHDSATFGLYNEITSNAAEAMAGGIHNIASGKGQFVIGTANEDNSDALFIVGNGKAIGEADIRVETDETKIARSNAFEVLKDGTIIIGSSLQYTNGMPVNSDVNNLIKYLSKDKIDLWDGSDSATSPEGKGTQDEPYIIASANDLYYFSAKILTGIGAQTSGTKLYAKQTTNIYLNDISDIDWYKKESINSFRKETSEDQIATSTKHPYGIEYDGDGYGIFGLYGTSLFGLGRVSSTIKNLILSNCYCYSEDSGVQVGGFFSVINGGTEYKFENCGIDEACHFVNKSAQGIGGFVGYARNSINISFINCFSIPCEITAQQNYGGLMIGNTFTAPSDTGKISLECCYGGGKASSEKPLIMLNGAAKSEQYPDNFQIEIITATYYPDINKCFKIQTVNKIDWDGKELIYGYINKNLGSMSNLQSGFKDIYGYVLPKTFFTEFNLLLMHNILSNMIIDKNNCLNLNNIQAIQFANNTVLSSQNVNDGEKEIKKLLFENQNILTDTNANPAASLGYYIEVVNDINDAVLKNNTLYFVKAATSSVNSQVEGQ